MSIRPSTIARRDDGQGLVEMLIALFILAVAIAALFTLMTAGALSLQRASQKGTAATLADKQLELYRLVGYSKIRLSQAALSGASAFTGYTSEPEASQTQVTDTTALATCTPLCAPVQTDILGPDHHYYRIYTYITTVTPPTVSGVTGRTVKQVLVVVRNRAGTAVLARNASTFDQSTAATTGS